MAFPAGASSAVGHGHFLRADSCGHHRGRKTVKAVAQPTKQGFLYVFDRVTGKPVWPIPEKPVEVGNVPGEWYSPTQPIPSKPPAYSRNGVSIDDLIDFTPALRERAKEIAAKYHLVRSSRRRRPANSKARWGHSRWVRLPAERIGPAVPTIRKHISSMSMHATRASNRLGLLLRRRKSPTLRISRERREEVDHTPWPGRKCRRGFS